MLSSKETPSTLLLTGEGVPDRSLIGGKAWSIANMMSLGLRVPPAFVITTISNARYSGHRSSEKLNRACAIWRNRAGAPLAAAVGPC